MNAPCLRDVAAHLGVRPVDLAAELRVRFDLVLAAASRIHQVADAEALEVHADLDAVAEFVAAVRMDLPVPYLPAPSLPVLGPDAPTASTEITCPERKFR